MALPYCHVSYQFYDIKMVICLVKCTQKVNDMFLGVPFNMVQLLVLIYMFAHHTGLKPEKNCNCNWRCYIFMNNTLML